MQLNSRDYSAWQIIFPNLDMHQGVWKLIQGLRLSPLGSALQNAFLWGNVSQSSTRAAFGLQEISQCSCSPNSRKLWPEFIP